MSRDDDAAIFFHEAYTKKRPDVMQDDDADDAGALGMGHDRVDRGEPEDETADVDALDDGDDEDDAEDEDEADDDETDAHAEERTIAVKCGLCGTRSTVAPPRGYKFIERGDDDSDGLSGKALGYSCPDCKNFERITRLRQHKLVPMEPAREAIDAFHDRYQGRRPSTEGLSAIETFRESYSPEPERDHDDDDGDDALVRVFREAYERAEDRADWRRCVERYPG